MRHPDYPARITHISETDFWACMRQRRARGDATLLAKAIRLGRRRQRKRAYETLAEYHAGSLVAEWNYYRDHGPPRPIHAPHQTADDVIKHRLYVAPLRPVQYGRVIEWEKPATGNNLDSFYWYLPLVERYLESPTREDAETLCDLVVQYYKARNHRTFPSPHYHPVYTALSGSLKLRHILPAYVALAVTRRLDARATEVFLKLMFGIARALFRRETDLVMNNQTITNAEAFGVFSSMFPELCEAPAMRQRAVERILQNMEQGFLPDGGYWERAFGYAGVSIRDAGRALRMLELSAPLDRDAVRRFTKVVRRAGRFYARILAPGYRAPPYADGGLGEKSGILDLVRDWFPPDTPEDLRQDRGGSYLFRDSGFAVMRNGQGPGSVYAFISFGRCDLWHCHRDCLNLDVWVDGHPVVIEAGRHGPYGHPQSRLFRMPPMHNVVAIEGQEWDENSPQLWRGENLAWQSNPQLDYVCATHRAYRGGETVTPQAANYRVRRAILLVKDPGYLLVHDTVAIDGDIRRQSVPGVASQYWHAVRPFRIVDDGCAVVSATTQLMIRTFASSCLRRTLTEPDYLPHEVASEVSEARRHRLCFRAWSDEATGGPIGFTTILYPFTGKQPALDLSTRTTLLEGGVPYQAEAIVVRTPAGTDRFVLNPDRLSGLRYRGKPVQRAGVTILRGNQIIQLQ